VVLAPLVVVMAPVHWLTVPADPVTVLHWAFAFWTGIHMIANPDTIKQVIIPNDSRSLFIYRSINYIRINILKTLWHIVALIMRDLYDFQ
jgi:hypothetical protein